MKLASLFDGSGGFPLAGVICGIEPVWSSEIEKYPLEVTAKRFPGVKQMGSVLDINGAEAEQVDIMTFGSPCQDLSVAGKQKGIHDGERSNLFFQAIRIIKEMRAHDAADGRTGIHVRPRFAVWENVPGAFSSNKGEDFAAVLEAFQSVCEGDVVSVPVPQGGWRPAGCIVGNGWSVAWRVYDAQYWGVPQRRRRIYIVADFASERAGEILFKRSGVPRDTEPSIAAWKGFAGHAAGGAGGSGTAFHLQQDPISSDDKSPCIGGQHQATVGIAAFMGGQGAKARGIGYHSDGTTPTLKAAPSGGNQVPDVVYVDSVGGKNEEYKASKVMNTLKATHYKHPPAIKQNKCDNYIVRRLTPLECCRLQGFPDWWTDGTSESNSARYKMWGNGIALPCAVDVLWRIVNN